MSKMTGWLPPHIKPVRVGVYEIKYTSKVAHGSCMYATWNGFRWSCWSHYKDDLYHTRFLEAVQDKYWRGFTEEQK